MARVGPRLLGVSCLAALLPALAVTGAARTGGGQLADAVLAVVDAEIVTASDIALARVLALHGFTPSASPIEAADVGRYVRVVLVLGEARRLAIDVPAAEVDDAWQSLETRAGGPAALDAWLRAVAVSSAWARRAVEAHVRWRRFIQLRFVELAFVAPDEVADEVGSAPVDAEARARAYERLRQAKAERALSEWLDARVKHASVRTLLGADERVPLPFAGFATGPR
ncbi:MAG: hypothetical protein HYU51_15445 [Candidatus Rokubacteria bacterium]|nr:hypothetical protein [Candidatus Rokubacteria bacterium]